MWQQNADAASALPEIKHEEETGPTATFPPQPNIIKKHFCDIFFFTFLAFQLSVQILKMGISAQLGGNIL